MRFMTEYKTDVERFLGEVVGYRRLKVLTDEGFLKNIVADTSLETRKERILAQFRNTFFGTMYAEIGPDKKADYQPDVEFSEILLLESVLKDDFGSSDTTGAPGEEDYEPFKTDSGDTKTQSDSNIHGRALTDKEIESDVAGIKLVGIIPKAKYVLPLIDRAFTSNDFCVSEKVDTGRAFLTHQYIQRLLRKAGFAEGSYVIRHSEEPSEDFSNLKEEIVLVNGIGYSVVFRPENALKRFSIKEEKKSRCSGTTIYLDTTEDIVKKLNDLVSRYHGISGVRRGGKRY